MSPAKDATSLITSETTPHVDSERTTWLMMAALFAIALIIRLACFTGLIASDDLGYAKYAEQIAQGTYRLEAHHYAIRYGVIVPLAAIYEIFGVHEWTTLILPLISSSLAPALLALVAVRLSGLREAWIAGLLLATFPLEIRYGSVLVPEPLMETLVIVAVLLFVVAEARNSSSLGLSAGFALGISYLTKEPAAFVALALCVFALGRRQWRLALTVASGAALVVAAEFAWYWSQSGDLLFRLHAMSVHNRSQMAMVANEHLSYRLWKAYPRMMLFPSTDFGLHSVMAVVVATLVSFGQRSSKVLLLLLWSIVPLLHLNFGSSSLQHYWALPVAPRYIGLVYAPLFLLSGIGLAWWAKVDKKRQTVVCTIVAVVCVVGVACAAVTQRTGYRIEHVKRLRAIADLSHRDHTHICGFRGTDATRWHQTLAIIAPDTLGCEGTSSLYVVPDSRGLPTIARQ